MKRNKGLIKEIRPEDLSSSASGVFDTFDVYQQKLINEWPETPVGQALFDVPGANTWTAPTGVSLVSIVLIGGGGSGRGNPVYGGGGGGGGLCWINNYPVTPGATYSLNVGAGGIGGHNGTSNAGSNSWFLNSSGVYRIVATGGEGGKGNPNTQNAEGGYPDIGSSALFLSNYNGGSNGGGNGGLGGVHNQGGGGGGAGGYSGNGGNGQGWTNELSQSNLGQTAGQGGAGGGGGRTNLDLHGAGGGVNVFGEGESGAAANATVNNIASSGYGGSGGSRGHNPPQSYRPESDYIGGDNTLTQHGGPFSTHSGQAASPYIDTVNFNITFSSRQRVGRLIWHYVNGGSFRGDIQIDTVALSGGNVVTYNFDSNSNSFLTSPDTNVPLSTWTADPTTELGKLVSVPTGTNSGRWNRDFGGTPSSSTGLSVVDSSWYLYAETSGRNYVNFWLASPEITIPAGAGLSVTYKQGRYGSNIGTIKSYFLEGANTPPPEVANGTYGGFYGGGGGGAEGSGGGTGDYRGGNGANGAIRIIWGPDRAFPNTNTIDLSN